MQLRLVSSKCSCDRPRLDGLANLFKSRHGGIYVKNDQAQRATFSQHQSQSRNVWIGHCRLGHGAI